MATKNTSKVTSDTTPDEILSTLGDAPTARQLLAAGERLTRLDAAIAVRTFDDTLRVKRAFGDLLSRAVVSARTAGGDAGKVGAVGSAVTFAHVGHALGVTGLDWTWADRKRATLSDDLNAWLYATPDAVRAYRTMADADRVLGKRTLSATNVQHAVQYVTAHRPGASASNRAAGAASDPFSARVVVSNDARVAVANDLAAVVAAGGDAVGKPIVVTMPDAGGIDRPMLTPDVVTPAWLAKLSAAELTAVIAACEGERKRRAIAASKGKGKTPAVPTPAPLTSAAVDAVAPSPDLAAIIAAAVQAAMAGTAAA